MIAQHLQNALENASKCNMDGIINLQKGETVHALRQFRRGIDALAKNLDETPEATEHVDTDAYIFSVRVTSEETNLREELFVQFDRALHMRCNTEDDEDDDDAFTLYHLWTAILTYNMGLVSHLVGSRRGNSQQLQRAEASYRLAYTCFSRVPHQWVQLGLMACSNNMGSVYESFRCAQQTKECHERLDRKSVV